MSEPKDGEEDDPFAQDLEEESDDFVPNDKNDSVTFKAFQKL